MIIMKRVFNNLNWGAFLFPYFWVIYNKMWFYLIVWIPLIWLVILPCLITFLPYSIYSKIPLLVYMYEHLYNFHNFPAYPKDGLFFDLIFRFLLGLKGNTIVKKKYKKENIAQFKNDQLYCQKIGLKVGILATVICYLISFFIWAVWLMNA